MINSQLGKDADAYIRKGLTSEVCIFLSLLACLDFHTRMIQNRGLEGKRVYKYAVYLMDMDGTLHALQLNQIVRKSQSDIVGFLLLNGRLFIGTETEGTYFNVVV